MSFGVVTCGRYPLAVKLGTITPNGADVYSYAPEEDSMVKVSKSTKCPGMCCTISSVPSCTAVSQDVV